MCVRAYTGLLLLPLMAAGIAAQQRDVPHGVPEHFPALRLYAEGEILEVLSGGRVVRILPPRGDDHGFGGQPPQREGASRLRGTRSLPVQIDQGMLVDLSRTQGWVFVDDPDGGPQQRVRLDRARSLFAPGQIIQIGPAPGLHSRASDFTAASRSSSPLGSFGTRATPGLAISGWIFIRLNRFRQAS